MTGSTAEAARRSFRTVAFFVFALALSGCAARGTGDAGDGQAPQAVPAVAVPSPATPAPPPLPRLIGLPHEEILGLLGQPTFQRQDAPALLLRYRGEGCILDLFLYPPIGPNVTGSPAVEHIEARTADGRPAAAGDCLAEVMKAKAAAGTG